MNFESENPTVGGATESANAPGSAVLDGVAETAVAGALGDSVAGGEGSLSSVGAGSLADADLDFVNEALGRGANHAVGVVGSTVALQMRCPNCRKLYSVDSKFTANLGSGAAKFECVNCKTTFYASALPGSAILQTRVEEIIPNRLGQDFEDELQNEVRVSALAAPLQGRVAKDLELAENIELVAAWDRLMNDYNTLAKHDEFVNACAVAGKLHYAAHKYAQILVAAPEEHVARRMRKRIQGLASFGLDAGARGMALSTWQFPLPSFNNFIIFLGTILIVTGLAFPHARQTAGLGFAMVLLAIGLRVFLRRPRG